MQFFVFGDAETGGLNGVLENGELGMQYYPIFEWAFIVTDHNLNEIGEPLHLIINQTTSEIEKSSKWAVDAHTKSGLLDKVKSSCITLEEAEEKIIEHLKSLGIDAYNRKEKTGAVFAGNSIMFDRSYMMCQMPRLHEYLHYRQLDVSALALATRAWRPELEEKALAVKQYKHEALADIRESIAELKVYRSHLFS